MQKAGLAKSVIEGFRNLAAEMLQEKIGINILNNKLYIEIHLVPDPVFVAPKVLAEELYTSSEL